MKKKNKGILLQGMDSRNCMEFVKVDYPVPLENFTLTYWLSKFLFPGKWVCTNIRFNDWNKWPDKLKKEFKDDILMKLNSTKGVI